MTCSICGDKTDGARLLCAKHYSVAKVPNTSPVPAEDMSKRREGREREMKK